MAGICAITLTATGIAFIESYDGLREWAAHHLLSGTWAWIWPVQVDAFILIGELSLYVAVLERWPRRRHGLGWAVTILGGVVSVLGNIGHVGGGHSAQVYGTAAVPPVAATAGLAVGLQVLKWALNLVRPKVDLNIHLVYWPPARAFQLSPIHWTLRTPGPVAGSPVAPAQSDPPPVDQPVRPVLIRSTSDGAHAAARATAHVRVPVSRTPKTASQQQQDYQARYQRGLKLYLSSLAEGQPLSQVKLAEALGQTNRKLAARIIRDVQNQQTERGAS